MVNQKTREWIKHVLWISRVKLIYARITLTRYTTLYFFLALLSCIVLVSLQTATYCSNTMGAYAVAGFLRTSNITTTNVGMSFLQDGDVILCQNIPGQTGANCTTLVKRVHSHMHVRDTIFEFDERETAPENPQQCALSLMWLEDVLSDARREDLGTLVFQVYLLTLSVVTVLNESLPHLLAGLAARVLATAWASFRVKGNMNLLDTYYHVVSAGKCDGYDPLRSWWNQSASHEIAGLVSNAVNLVLMAALSYKLFTVYASQTFSRVGASTEVNRIYKLVLLLSVILQLSGFFTLGQAALWIDKISFGAIRQLAEHFFVYLAELVVTAVLVIPWLILGWISVRRESKPLFLVFCFISLILLMMSTALFFSPLNRFVLREWSFYATMSVTAYILLVATVVLAIICRLQFGKGLAHFLRVTDALEDGDFTPVYFSKGDDAASYKEDSKSQLDPEMPVLGYSDPTDEKLPQRPEPAHGRKLSSMSVLFAEDSAGKSPADTIKLSSTPALFRNATEKRVSVSPIVVQPVVRSSSITSNSTSPSRLKGTRPPNIKLGADLTRQDSYVLPAIAVSPMNYNHTRSETVDERPSRDRSTAEPAKPAKPAPAAARSQSVPRKAATGLPRRPSDGKSKPPGNYF
ncbi:hypothetical protein MVEN_02581200 [Mycena venus]|uniref:Uncharacterized protein n=1 Tax=Mycena venus TaxID=2733690 RepID=A0A8H6TZB6_9AGAR|nr:hypothetical protein MVEN_02581200 [Mycena venus]